MRKSETRKERKRRGVRNMREINDSAGADELPLWDVDMTISCRAVAQEIRFLSKETRTVLFGFRNEHPRNSRDSP